MIKHIYYIIKFNNFSKKLLKLALLMIIGIFFETFGLALLFPVLEVVGKPEIIQTYQIGRKLLEIQFLKNPKNVILRSLKKLSFIYPGKLLMYLVFVIFILEADLFHD